METLIRYYIHIQCKRANLEKTLANIEKEGEYSVRTITYNSDKERYELILDSLNEGFKYA